MTECYACSKLAELRAENNALHVKLDGQECADVSQAVEDTAERVTNKGEMLYDSREKLGSDLGSGSQVCYEVDTREKLEADVCAKLNDMARFSWRVDGIFRQAQGWLDRQEAITSAEWERATDVVKAERDEWKAKAESSSKVRAGSSNLEWLFEHDRDFSGTVIAAAQIRRLCPDDCETPQQVGEWLMAPHEDEGDESCRQDAEQPERVESADCESDSREKLEADMRWQMGHFFAWDEKREEFVGYVLEWLDRQEAITERECADTRVNFAERMRFGVKIDELQARVDELTEQLETAHAKNRLLKAHIGKMQAGRHGWHVKYPDLEKKNAELQAKVDELTAERDEWKIKCETYEFAYKQADAERKRYSEQIDELTAERDQWREAAGNAHAMWEKADNERNELKRKEKQLSNELGLRDKAIELLQDVKQELIEERDELKRENARLSDDEFYLRCTLVDMNGEVVG